MVALEFCFHAKPKVLILKESRHVFLLLPFFFPDTLGKLLTTAWFILNLFKEELLISILKFYLCNHKDIKILLRKAKRWQERRKTFVSCFITLHTMQNESENKLNSIHIVSA